MSHRIAKEEVDVRVTDSSNLENNKRFLTARSESNLGRVAVINPGHITQEVCHYADYDRESREPLKSTASLDVRKSGRTTGDKAELPPTVGLRKRQGVFAFYKSPSKSFVPSAT
ncbi:hypothetical protein NQZ68_027261 [Dissostichus eleginoides]|nr:hypothetical protein NQZ68_027261 [Dissostichus eleginoides]